jgi:cAMP phosphodiesterase
MTTTLTTADLTATYRVSLRKNNCGMPVRRKTVSLLAAVALAQEMMAEISTPNIPTTEKLLGYFGKAGWMLDTFGDFRRQDSLLIEKM